MAQPADSPKEWNLGPALCGWLIPGLAHVLIGEKRRGAIVGVTIALLWLLGLLIGGVGVIDRHTSGIMYYGQIMLAPGVAVDIAMQRYFRAPLREFALRQPSPYAPHHYQPSFGRPNEQGVLYTSLAGWLNLLALLDVLARPVGVKRRDLHRPDAEADDDDADPALPSTPRTEAAP